MLKKNNKQIIDLLKVALVKEELALPLYASHIQKALFWSGLPQKKQKSIITILKILKKDSEGHVKRLKKIIRLYSKQQ